MLQSHREKIHTKQWKYIFFSAKYVMLMPYTYCWSHILYILFSQTIPPLHHIIISRLHILCMTDFPKWCLARAKFGECSVCEYWVCPPMSCSHHVEHEDYIQQWLPPPYNAGVPTMQKVSQGYFQQGLPWAIFHLGSGDQTMLGETYYPCGNPLKFVPYHSMQWLGQPSSYGCSSVSDTGAAIAAGLTGDLIVPLLSYVLLDLLVAYPFVNQLHRNSCVSDFTIKQLYS